MFRTTLAALLALGLAAPGLAQEQIAYKSAKAGTSYYQMGVELAEAIRAATDGAMILTVEESQGSVQNVMEAPLRGGAFVFTTPPSLIERARDGAKPFEDRPTEGFQGIRALFPIPSLTMHFIMKGEGAVPFDSLEGMKILVGRGTFSAREGMRYLELFGMTDKVEIADAELGSASDAFKNGQIDAFVTASSFPAPNVIETAASAQIAIATLTEAQVAQTGATPITIPGGTYAGVDEDIHTTSLPVVAWTMDAMSEETAYKLTATFWDTQDKLEEKARWWGSVSPEMVAGYADRLHPGARRWYVEQGVLSE